MRTKKSRLRMITWEDYGISEHRYKELKEFCLQYDEKKEKIRRDINGIQYSDMPKGNVKPDNLENQAIRNTIYIQDCEMIEQAAIAAASDIYPYIIKSVTKGLSFYDIEYDTANGRIPLGSTEFYAKRRLFYHYLDMLKNGEKITIY